MNFETIVTYASVAAATLPGVRAYAFNAPLGSPPSALQQVVSVRSALPATYQYAVEDLDELRDPTAYGPDEVPVSAEALEAGALIIQQLSAVAPAPAVSALQNGVLSIVWTHANGFVSVEIGQSRYGLLIVRDSVPIRMKNGPTWELLSLTGRDIHNFFAPAQEALADRSFTFDSNRRPTSNRLVSAF